MRKLFADRSFVDLFDDTFTRDNVARTNYIYIVLSFIVSKWLHHSNVEALIYNKRNHQIVRRLQRLMQVSSSIVVTFNTIPENSDTTLK